MNIASFLISDRVVMTMISLNALVLILDSFRSVHDHTGTLLTLINHLFTLCFVAEIILKISVHGLDKYWQNRWNRVDFILILMSLPSLITIFVEFKFFSALLILRLSRLVQFFRLLRFVPHGPQLWAGIVRALKASIGVFLALFLLNLLFAMGATFLFGEYAPEHFENPLVSFYSIFKIFTVEGWYEIPEQIAQAGGAYWWQSIVRGYFMLAVFVGGILGLSLANAVFVDEMVFDNNSHLEFLVEHLEVELQDLREEMHDDNKKLLHKIHEELEEIKALLVTKNG